MINSITIVNGGVANKTRSGRQNKFENIQIEACLYKQKLSENSLFKYSVKNVCSIANII